jgi:PAS domain S-box-containing protein
MFPEILAMPSALVTSLVNTAQITFRDELLSVKNAARDLLALEFDRLNADVVVPLIEEADVIGFLCLGQKRSGDPYFSDDADLLATLANQSSVAIRNAQTHQRVVQLNEELQTILSTIESGVVAVGAKARITLFNRTAERLIGMPAISAKGQRVEDLPPALARCLGETLADGEPRSQVEFSLPDAAGQLVPLVCSTSALVTPAGQRVGAVAAVNDISHLKELEHEKRRTERLASIEAIAAGLVHEIRNPLVAVKTFSQLLPTKYHDPEFRETFSRTAGREIRRIDDLLTRFRTLVSASSQPLESVDITDPIRHTLDFLRPQFDERQIRVRQVWDGAPRSILGNTPQLEQLFLNLCLNAMEAMGAGGELTLRVADLTEGGGTTLLVEVSDTGTGIPEELLAKIFDPFVSTKARGSGLGLAICRGVADAHRARLRARNNTARPGSTFTIEFPVPVAEPSTAIAT